MGGGGGSLTPNFGRYVPWQSEKWGALELTVGDIRLALWPAAANPGVQSIQAGCSKPAVGGDKKLERKEISKMMVSGMAKI